MAKKVTRKELLGSPDEFMTFSERAVRYAQAHSRELNIIGIAIAAACILYLGISWYMGYSDRKGQEAYNKAYYALREMEAAKGKIDDPKRPIELFQQVEQEHGMANVSDLALPQLARLKFLEGNIDEAISLYKEFRSETPGNSIYASMTRLALCACFEAKKDFQAAIQELQPIVDDQDALLREQALVGLARIYRLSDNPDEAQNTVKILEKDYPESTFLQFAESLLQ
jgi:predicted negative regulator of RcsB-dependent stress response